MTIDFQDIFERCMMESAYIGRNAAQEASDAARGTTDEKIFSRQYAGKFRQLRIRESDNGLVKTFIREGAHLTESRLSALMSSQGEYSSENVVWHFISRQNPPHFPTLFFDPDAEEATTHIPDASHGNLNQNQGGLDESRGNSDESQGLYGLLEDLLTAYALWRWLADKAPELSALYASKWNDGIEQVKTMLFVQRLRKPVKQRGEEPAYFGL